MRSIEDQLANYARYHRDPRNIATHFIGIPLIVFAIATLLARPSISLLGLPYSPAAGLACIVGLYYLRLELKLGLLMCLVLATAVAGGHAVATLPTLSWLAIGIGSFVVGWIFQLVGHVFEGRKPAFVDDLVGLIIGPLFVLVELLAKLGLARQLNAEIERRAGPQRLRSTMSDEANPQN